MYIIYLTEVVLDATCLDGEPATQCADGLAECRMKVDSSVYVHLAIIRVVLFAKSVSLTTNYVFSILKLH